MITPRIPLPDAPDTPGISGAAYEAYAPEIGAAMLAYKIPLGRMKSVDYITKELVRLRNAHISGCQICGNFRNPRRSKRDSTRRWSRWSMIPPMNGSLPANAPRFA